MTFWQPLLALAMIMFVLMSGGWLWQRRHRNAGIVDVLWSTGLAMAAVLIAVAGNGAALPRLTLVLLAGGWATRLAWHLWHRVRHEAEDGRYRYLRDHWHDHQGKFFGFFQLQAGLVVLFALPFLAVAENPRPTIGPAWMIGVAIGLISVVGEASADHQLARFRRTPAHRGKTCREGWWRYSRHPNYFFEWLHWFAYVALAWDAPHRWLSFCGPVTMYLFLRLVSGIPFTEAQALRSRGDDYRDYQRSTSMLIPWFPKRSTKRT